MTTSVEQRQLVALSFEAVGLGDRSYLLHDGEFAIVVDPQREPERYLAAARDLGVRITHVLDTHIHNDYVSGGLGLARVLGATYVVPAGEDVEFADECVALEDGDLLSTGSFSINALASPGHTLHHLSYLVRSDSTRDAFLCSGGSVLAGAVGRTDLLGSALAPELAASQWRSVRRQLVDLEPWIEVLPTHGFGSFCSAAPVSGGEGGRLTIESELRRNPAIHTALDVFVAKLLTDPPPIPAYYRHMAPLNRKGASAPQFLPGRHLEADEILAILRAGGAVADLRQRRSFAASHRRGAVNLELGANLTTYFGWTIDFESPYALIAESTADVEECRRMLARIGHEQFLGFALAGELDPTGDESYPVEDFAGLATAVTALAQLPVVLDIRHPSEWNEAHLSIARHVPLPDLGGHRAGLPKDALIWVHCAAGYRAAVASSQLAGWGMHPVLIDDTFEHARIAGLEVVSPGSHD